MVAFPRRLLAVGMGLVTAMVLIAVIQMFGHHLYPPPPGVDLNNSESPSAHVRSMPAGAFGLLLMGWAVGTFVGSWVATRTSPCRKPAHGMVIGVVFLLGSIAMMVMIPHPGWVMVVGLGMFLPIAYLGAWLATDRTIPVPI